MADAYVCDVGDGLCMAISTRSGETVLVDCGSTVGFWNSSAGRDAFEGLKRIVAAMPAPNTLFLSHYHLDHYSGLAYAGSRNATSVPKLSISRVLYPGIPAFSVSREFMCAILTMNLRLLGDKTGIAAYELFDLITRLSGGVKPSMRAVYQGDTITVANSMFFVLWPPRTLAANQPIAKEVTRAVEAFEEAKSIDEPTRRWEAFVRNSAVADQGNGSQEARWKLHADALVEIPRFETRELPPQVERANWLIRKAANRLSLCFCETQGEYISLGDIRAREIKQVIDTCLANGLSSFGILVTPHHGTRWNQALLEVRCERAVSSCGPRLLLSVVSYFKEISNVHYVTWLTGDLPFTRLNGHWFQFP